MPRMITTTASLPRLSGGEQQRVAIARALVNDPMLVLADEPTGNLDPEITVDIMKLFLDINIRGTTVLIASHDRHLSRNLDSFRNLHSAGDLNQAFAHLDRSRNEPGVNQSGLALDKSFGKREKDSQTLKVVLREVERADMCTA